MRESVFCWPDFSLPRFFLIKPALKRINSGEKK
jgi:hypothetical protein